MARRIVAKCSRPLSIKQSLGKFGLPRQTAFDEPRFLRWKRDVLRPRPLNKWKLTLCEEQWVLGRLVEIRKKERGDSRGMKVFYRKQVHNYARG